MFDSDSQVTTSDLLALPSVRAAPSGDLTEFVADIELFTSPTTELRLDRAALVALGLEPPSFVKLTQPEAIDLVATVDLRFGFGLDPMSGDFFIEDPALVAQLSLSHDQPLDISLELGPVGVGVEGGTFFLEAGLLLPTEGRFAVDELAGLSIGTPRFDPTSNYEVDLPFVAQGALSGIGEIGRIHGSFNRDGDGSQRVEDLSPDPHADRKDLSELSDDSSAE